MIVRPNPLVRPFLKWAGGKRQLLAELMKYVPKQYGTYFEPFVGGGALFFALQHRKAVISDTNEELINCYEIVRAQVEDLISILEEHRAYNSEDYYYEVRDWDRQAEFGHRDPVQRAARIIYLNKSCYNGLFRVNSQGQFNVPYGKYAAPNIVDRGVLRAVSRYLNEADVQILHTDFTHATCSSIRGDFVYFDPPYDPVSSTASFTGYDVNGFGRADQRRLKQHIDALKERGCKVLLSNAYTPFIEDLYQGYSYAVVGATRAINSNAQRRGRVDEILVTTDEQGISEQHTNQKRHRMEEAVRGAFHSRGGESLWSILDQLESDQSGARKPPNGKVRPSRKPADSVPRQ